MKKLATLCIIGLFTVLPVINYSGGAKGELPDTIIFNEETYVLQQSSFVISSELQYSGHAVKGYRILIPQSFEILPDTIYLEVNCATARKYLLKDNIIGLPQPALNYTISDCLRQPENTKKIEKIQVCAKKGEIIVYHLLTYVCCAEIELKTTVHDNVITIEEINNGDICKCICDYMVSADITNLESGRYTLIIKGVLQPKTQDPYTNYDTIWEGEVTIP
ncbi:MAG: hypothetical protein ACXQTP_00515 [Candidatus Methanofastidiosia archaeon]